MAGPLTRSGDATGGQQAAHPRDHAVATPDRAACIMATSGAVVTYATLETSANRFARWLREVGVRAGDVVALMIENGSSFYPLVWGAHRAGAFYLPVATGLTTGEVRYIVEDSGAVLTIVSAKSAAHLGDGLSALNRVVLLEDTLLPAMTRLPDAPIADETPGADMLYSSGTTGRPKGIKGASLPTFEAPDRATTLGATHFGYGAEAVYLCPAPLYHAAPLRWSMAIHRFGGTVVLMERFDAEKALAMIERHRVTVAQFVPTHLSRMLSLPRHVRDRYDLSSLQCVFHAGAPCPPALKRALIDWLGPIVWEFYSGSEGLGLTLIDSHEWLDHPGSVGRAIVGSIRICGPDGEPLPTGREGLVRFADVRRFEYHGDPEKTATAYNRHGWPTLGDIGRLDDEGYLYLTDRAEFTIISGGVNIYPQEIEHHLLTHDAITDVGVVGLPHADLGQVVTAFVEPRSWPVADADALVASLDAHARSGLSSVKVPRRYILRGSLGRTETGKLRKRLLVEQPGER